MGPGWTAYRLGTEKCHAPDLDTPAALAPWHESMASEQWAKDLKVFLVPLASASSSRRGLWRDRLLAAGAADVFEAPSPKLAGLSHAVLAPELTRERLDSWLKREAIQLNPEAWVTTDWLIACLARQRLAPEAQFSWPPATSAPSSPAKRQGRDEGANTSPRKASAAHVAATSPTSLSQSPAKRPHAAIESPTFRKLAWGADAASAKPHQDSGSEVEEVPKMSAFNGQLTPLRERLLRSKQKFACQRSEPARGNNHALADLFSRMQKHYESLGDGWRERSYRMTASLLRGLTFEISGPMDLQRPELRRLGRKTREKLLEFLQTGKIGRVEGLHEDEATIALNELQGIWGVGLTTARRWHGMGCRSVADVRQRVKDGQLQLNQDQVIGLDLYEHFAERIPREEVQQLLEAVREACQGRFGPRLRLEACGSYRRGKASCGDVDLLISARSPEEEFGLGSCKEVLGHLIADLTKQGFLTHDLKGSKWHEGDVSTSSACYFGVCKLPEKETYRRIDLKVHPVLEFPFALLSFTGSGPFNRSMRLFARRAGFSLSDHGICQANHARGNGRGQRLWTGPPIDQHRFITEKDIFDFLGLAYREPWQREVDAQWLLETGTDLSAAAASMPETAMSEAMSEVGTQPEVVDVDSDSEEKGCAQLAQLVVAKCRSLHADPVSDPSGSAYLPQIRQMSDGQILAHWRIWRCPLPEYQAAAAQICVSRRFMCDTLLLRAVRQLHLAGAEELKQLSAWPGIVSVAALGLIDFAYGLGDVSRAHAQCDVMSQANIFQNLMKVHGALEEWKKPLFVLSLLLLRQLVDPSTATAKLAEVTDRGLNCPQTQVTSFSLLLLLCAQRILTDQQQEQGSRQTLLTCFEHFMDSHKEQAMASAFIEPNRLYWAKTAGRPGCPEWLQNNVDAHAVNWYTALLNSTLAIQVPHLPVYWDSFAPPVVDFWEGLTEEAWGHFRANFGRRWQGIPQLKADSPSPIRRKDLRGGYLPHQPPRGLDRPTQQLGAVMNAEIAPAGRFANEAVNPSGSPEVRRCLARYVERFGFFFSKAFFVRRCFEALNGECKPEFAGARAAMQDLFAQYRRDPQARVPELVESLEEYCYKDDMFVELDVEATSHFLQWLQLIEP
ncbi:unnamed protein product [Effrenium voratum]|nr:unnamed protein product [Effrenium voratum]